MGAQRGWRLGQVRTVIGCGTFHLLLPRCAGWSPTPWDRCQLSHPELSCRPRASCLRHEGHAACHSSLLPPGISGLGLSPLHTAAGQGAGARAGGDAGRAARLVRHAHAGEQPALCALGRLCARVAVRAWSHPALLISNLRGCPHPRAKNGRMSCPRSSTAPSCISLVRALSAFTRLLLAPWYGKNAAAANRASPLGPSA